MIMPPAPYSPHGLVVPRSYEPLPLALHCCALYHVGFFVLGPLEYVADNYVGHKSQV